MITKLGNIFTILFQKHMPNAFVFAMLLTLLTGLTAFFWINTTPLKIIESWYDSFWSLMEFAMQVVLIIITGFAIALSPFINKGIDKVTSLIKTPKHVYFFMFLIS